MPREISSSKLLNSVVSNAANNDISNNISLSDDFEELIVTIKKSERGFGFDLKNGILVQNVFPSKLFV